jgi:hypothetical protein
VADYVREHLINDLKNLPSFKSGDYEQALIDVYLKTDDQLRTTYAKQKLLQYKK